MKDTRLKIGTFIYGFRSPGIAKILKSSGFDFFIIDCEHGMFTWETVEDIVSVANAAGIKAFVRISMISRENISKALDSGAKGIIIPYIKCAREVEQVIMYAKYPPYGQRGVALLRGNTDYMPVQSNIEYTKWANENIMIIPQIETNEAMEELDEIASVPGISGLFFGAVDLSAVNSIQDPFTDKFIFNSFKKMVDACKKYNVKSIVHLTDLETLMKWTKAVDEVDMISYSADVPVMMTAYKKAICCLLNQE